MVVIYRHMHLHTRQACQPLGPDLQGVPFCFMGQLIQTSGNEGLSQDVSPPGSGSGASGLRSVLISSVPTWPCTRGHRLVSAL
jgi:hypothetical protein